MDYNEILKLTKENVSLENQIDKIKSIDTKDLYVQVGYNDGYDHYEISRFSNGGISQSVMDSVVKHLRSEINKNDILIKAVANGECNEV